MDDALLARRAVAGDLESFGQLYDRYFQRIYDFSWRILRNSEESADVTQDVFMKAMQGLPSLAKAASFKSWLFTIAHNTAVSRAERAGRAVPMPAEHEEAFGSFDVPDPSRIDSPEQAIEDQELSALVWEAATALSPRDYAILDLHVRQGLDSAEIAAMGVSKGNAYTMVSRMKSAAGDVIAGYVVARRGSKDCETLQAILLEHTFPPYTEAVRRAVDAHIKDCDVCQETRKLVATPLSILGSFAMVPAPFALKGDIWRNIAAGWGTRGADAAAMAGAPGGLAAAAAGGALLFDGGGDDGLPPVSPAMGGGDDQWGGKQFALFGAGIVAFLLFSFMVVFAGSRVVGALGDDDGGGDGTPTSEGDATPDTTGTPGVFVETSTPEPTLTPTMTSEATLTFTPAPPTNTPPPLPSDTPLVETPTPADPPTRTPRPTRTPDEAETPEPPVQPFGVR